MIVRIFRATVTPGTGDEFEQKLRRLSVPRLDAADGLLWYVVGRPLGEAREFTVVTLWRDLEALRAFAGPDWREEAVIHQDELPLLEDTTLHHYEAAFSSSLPRP